MPRLLRTCLSIAFVAWCVGALALDTWGKTRRAEGVYDAIIVAGCRVYPDGRPSPALEWRVRKAVELWEKGAAPRVVFTGGVGDFPPAEAEASARLAQELGMPRTVMLLEDRSTSTIENARNAAAELPAAAQMRVLVVTDAYHVFRARRLFAEFFGKVDAVGSTYGVVSRVRGAFREVLALCKYALT
ncbi:MAG: YdcF family protein [Verrucomicrobiota bacterium]